MWMLFLLVLPLLSIVYLCWHLWVLVPLPALWRSVLIAVMIVSFLFLFCSVGHIIDHLPLRLARWVYDIGCSSIIVLLYLTVFFLVLDLGRLVRIVPRAWLYQNGGTTLILAAGIFILLLYGNIHYYNKVREELTLVSPKPLVRPLKLVFVSDLHLGYHNTRKELSRWVDMINAE